MIDDGMITEVAEVHIKQIPTCSPSNVFAAASSANTEALSAWRRTNTIASAIVLANLA